MEPFEAIRSLLDKAVTKKDIPGASVAVGNSDKTLFAYTCGVENYGGKAVSSATYYDLASLTKVVSTLPAILRLIDEGELKLEDKVGKFIHNAGWFQAPSLADVTIKQLLIHSSGLPAWKALFAWVSKRQTALANVLQTELKQPAGTFVYSDLGFITLGAIIERITKMKQNAFVKKHLFAPLGMTQTKYGPLESHAIASTEDCPWRNEILRGTVHDENAYCLEHIAGHAGLFGVAEDLAQYARAWLNFDSHLGNEAVLSDAIKEHLNQNGIRRGLGWALKGDNSFAGSLASSKGFGHTGFTGTSLWIEPENNWFAVLLTNRVHPSRQCGTNIHQVRRSVHDLIAKELA